MTQPTGSLSSMDLPDEEIIRYAVEKLHMTEEYARFVLAMERGLIPSTGDVLAVEGEDGDAAGEGDEGES
jgi:hypothetical protein